VYVVLGGTGGKADNVERPHGRSRTGMPHFALSKEGVASIPATPSGILSWSPAFPSSQMKNPEYRKGHPHSTVQTAHDYRQFNPMSIKHG
jgi:hypothetical protein